MRFHLQDVFIDFQSCDEARALISLCTDGQAFGSSACSERVLEVWGKVRRLGYDCWSFPRRTVYC